MITLSVLIYTCIALYIAASYKISDDGFGNMKEHTWTNSLLFGFLILPGIAGFFALLLGAFWCFIQVVSFVFKIAQWIYINLP